MIRKITLVLLSILSIGVGAQAQWLISTAGVTTDTITFDASFTGVNNGSFNGGGLDSSPAAGQLNSNAWLFNGFSDGSTTYGGTHTSGDYARGGSAGGIFSGGIYSFEVAPGDSALGVQPTGGDYTPGDLELKVVNTTGGSVDSVFVAYDLIVNNDGDRGNTFNFAYSTDGGATFNAVSALDYTSVELSQGSVIWVNTPKSTGLNVTLNDNDTIIFQWASDDALGGGSRDEFALDNIRVNMFAAPPVSSDTTKPVVMDGVFNSATSITVVYSEPVTMATATDLANYAITPGISVTAAVQSTSLDSVTLTISPGLTSGTLFTANIMNVTDTSANANVMDPFSTDFYFNDYNGSDLMITEIMYGQNSSGIQDIDYFEVHNSGAAAISLAGMELVSGMDLFIDSNVSIAAGGYLVITEDVDSFMVAFPTVTNVIGVDNGSLSGGGELIAMENTLGDVVVSLDYETSAPWPAYTADGSIELCDLTSDNTDGANWYYAGTVSSTVADMLYGTPGAANSCAAKPVIPTYDIEVLRTNDANGEPDSIDVYCAVEGIVYGKDMDGNAGYTFVLKDDTRGITIHSFVDVDNYVVNQGDELRCVGSVKFYNGLTQFRVDSITVLSTGHCIDYPEIVFELNEETESEPIQLIQVMIADPSAWPSAGSNANMDVVTMDGDTLLMRIDKDTYIADTITSAPTGYFNLHGVGSQFDGSAPYDEGYQIMPQFVADFDTVPATASGLYINEVLVDNQSVNMDPQGDYDSWIEIYNSNATDADLTGLLIGNDDTVYQFSKCIGTVTVPANGFKLLWADDEQEDGADHLPFEIWDEDFLGFATKEIMILDTAEWDSALADVSYGKRVDGTGAWVSFEVTTPEATNAGGWELSVVNALAVNPINVYPNPSNTGNINFNKVVSFNMFSITGQLVMTQNNVNRVNVSNLEKGVYILETTEGEVVKVILK